MTVIEDEGLVDVSVASVATGGAVVEDMCLCTVSVSGLCKSKVKMEGLVGILGVATVGG